MLDHSSPKDSFKNPHIEIEFFTNEELIIELNKRFDRSLVLLEKDGSNPNIIWHGSSSEVLGMIAYLEQYGYHIRDKLFIDPDS